jgi:hypothetical protein
MAFKESGCTKGYVRGLAPFNDQSCHPQVSRLRRAKVRLCDCGQPLAAVIRTQLSRCITSRCEPSLWRRHDAGAAMQPDPSRSLILRSRGLVRRPAHGGRVFRDAPGRRGRSASFQWIRLEVANMGSREFAGVSGHRRRDIWRRMQRGGVLVIGCPPMPVRCTSKAEFFQRCDDLKRQSASPPL